MVPGTQWGFYPSWGVASSLPPSRALKEAVGRGGGEGPPTPGGARAGAGLRAGPGRVARTGARLRSPVLIPRLRRSWTMSWVRPGHSPARSTPMYPGVPGPLVPGTSVGPLLDQRGRRERGGRRRRRGGCGACGDAGTHSPPARTAPQLPASRLQGPACGATCWPRAGCASRAVGAETARAARSWLPCAEATAPRSATLRPHASLPSTRSRLPADLPGAAFCSEHWARTFDRTDHPYAQGRTC